MSFHSSLALLPLISEKSINRDDFRWRNGGGWGVLGFSEGSEKWRMINFSSRRSNRVCSIFTALLFDFRISVNSSVRGRYTPFGWKPGL